jgi:hypothetical protein
MSDDKPVPIKIARGNLATRQNTSDLQSGELFWQVQNDLGQYPNLPYDEGSLYIGYPSLDKSAKKAIKISDRRSLKALVFRGELNSLSDLTSDIFKKANIGDFYVFNEDTKTGIFYQDKFNKNDILYVTNVTLDPLTGLVSQNEDKTYKIEYRQIKVSNDADDEAYKTQVEGTNPLKDASTVRSAIDTLSIDTLHYRGIIVSSLDSVVNNEKCIGALYCVNIKGVTFPSKDNSTWISKRGDLALYQGSTKKWTRIPTGSDASDIYVDTLSYSLNNTFDSDHKSKFASLSDLQSAIQFLAQNKAQIDSTGKVPLAQLPDAVVGALVYKGEWNPISDDKGVNNIAYQNNWPGYTFASDGKTILKVPVQGYYWIVNTSKTVVNIQYVDKQSINSDGIYTRKIELNNGDWIIYTPGTTSEFETQNNGYFAVIDNSSKVSLLEVILNAYDEGLKASSLSTTSTFDQVGNVKLKAAKKIGIYKENDVAVVAGLHLIDQDTTDNSIANRIPRYTNDSTSPDTIKNSHIEDSDVSGVKVYHNFQVGTNLIPHLSKLYGDVYILPKYKDVNTKMDTSVLYFGVNQINSKGELNDYVSLQEVKPQEDIVENSRIYLPNKSSTIIAKLDEEVLKNNFLLKAKIIDGKVTPYLTDSSLEEHLNEDGSFNKLESHSDDFIVPRTIDLRQIVFGDIYSTTDEKDHIDDDGNTKDNRKVVVNINNEQTKDTILKVTLPLEDGRLLTIEKFNKLLSNGTPDYLPIYGEKNDHGDTILQDSLVHMKILVLFALYDAKINSNKTSLENTTLSSKFFTGYEAIKNLIIESDTVIGTPHNPKALGVTKGILLGNELTNLNAILPGRSNFNDEFPYKDPLTDKTLTEETVVVELPARSGVLLSHNSTIDGGEFY